MKQVSVSDVKEEAEGCDIVITRRGRPADVLNDPVEPHRHPHRERGGVANHLGEPLGGLDQPVARHDLVGNAVREALGGAEPAVAERQIGGERARQRGIEVMRRAESADLGVGVADPRRLIVT
ncbi:MAG TPA: hypothetical protein VFW46_19140 [Stellaceae bacterium]|nr:hypothetical protein [Stellaceae bacterium]